MPPKPDTNTERIMAIEGQLGGLSSILETMRTEAKEIREEAKMNTQRLLEMERRAEERHQQTMSASKQPMVLPVEGSNPGNLGSKNGSCKETQRSVTESPPPPVQGLHARPEKGLLHIPETVTPFRSVEISAPLFTAGSSGLSAQQKNGSPPKKLELQEFEGKNPDDWIFRVQKCFSVNQTEEDEKLMWEPKFTPSSFVYRRKAKLT